MDNLKICGTRIDNDEWVLGYYVKLKNRHFIYTGEFAENNYPERYEIYIKTLTPIA